MLHIVLVPRLFRLLAVLAVLLGTLPCELREALPALSGLVAPCCDEEEDEDPANCCDAVTCACAAPVMAAAAPVVPPASASVSVPYEPARFDRPTTRAGPPPLPPPI